MKRILPLLLILFFANNCLAQPKRPNDLKVILFESKLRTYLNTGIDDFGQDIKVAFFKDLILFETQMKHFKSDTTYLDFDNDQDTIFSDSDPIFDKITFQYYVIKAGAKEGLYFEDKDSLAKTFNLDTFRLNHNMSKKASFADMKLGKPKDVIYRNKGQVIVEKYVNLDPLEDVDTIYRTFDRNMVDINFSISERLDHQYQSKLSKLLVIQKLIPKLEDKIYAFKWESLEEISLITDKCTAAQLENFRFFFAKFVEINPAKALVLH